MEPVETPSWSDSEIEQIFDHMNKYQNLSLRNIQIIDNLPKEIPPPAQEYLLHISNTSIISQDR